MPSRDAGERFNLYQHVTDKIVAQLEQGIVPWAKPWRQLRHVNVFSKKEYRGINPWILSATPFEDIRWAGFGQIRSHGGSVLKGAKSSLIVYYKWIKKEDKNGEEERFPLFRYLQVFNVEQTNLIDIGKIPSTEEYMGTAPTADDATAESVFINMQNPPKFRYDVMMEATYCKALDEVTMPPKGTFDEMSHYYGTLYHELTHSTMHESRLGRQFVSRPYEEMVAEMGAAMIAAEVGVNADLEQSAAYIGNWLSAMRGDNKYVIHAAGAAQKAADYILGNTYKPNEDKESSKEG